MSLPIYESWKKVAVTPSEYWKESLQALSNNTFENASDVFTVQEEQTFGALDWSSDLTVRITHVFSDRQTGEKLGDDFRNLIFPDLTRTCVLGQRYSFDSNYWITTNTDKYKYPTISAVIRRCNNVLKNYDSDGVLHTEPCIIDYTVRSVDFDFNQNIIIPDGHTTIIIQGNDWTKTFKLNQRFMFGGQAWKCTYLNNYQRTSTLDEDSVNIIRMVLMKDSIDTANDNVTENIPNENQYVYTISIDQTDFEGNVDDTGTITASIFLNGELVDKDITFTSSDTDIATINSTSGAYTLIAEGDVTFTATMTDNSLISDSVNVTVTASVVDTYQVIISPSVNEIYFDESQSYSCYLYKNNEQQSGSVSVSASGISTTYYTLTIVDGNHFTITNLKAYSAGKLTLTCTLSSYSSTLEISLKGAF